MQKNARRSGFTLPEVLVTVTVVAVLAAVVVPAVTQYIGRGAGPATATDITQIQNAITGYVADTRQFPTLLGDLTTSTAPAGITGTFHGPYLAGQVITTSTVNTGVSAFTSSGLGLVFADSINNGLIPGYLTLYVIPGVGGTSCKSLLELDSLIDSNGATGDGAAAGRVRWTDGSPTCTGNPTTGVFSAGHFGIIPAGT